MRSRVYAVGLTCVAIAVFPWCVSAAPEAAPSQEYLAPAPEFSILALAGIIPNIIPSLAAGSTIFMDLLYNDTSVSGALLQPSQAAQPPTIVISGADAGDLFTLFFIDPDVPDPANPVIAQVLHGLITNIPGGDVTRGTVVTTYLGPAPPSGVHRYTFLLYKQPGGNRIEVQDPSTGNFGRSFFNVANFANGLGLGDPVAGDYFLSSPQ